MTDEERDIYDQTAWACERFKHIDNSCHCTEFRTICKGNLDIAKALNSEHGWTIYKMLLARKVEANENIFD